jgi:hypothetical protein
MRICRVRQVSVYAGPSQWGDLKPHFLDGRKYPLITVRVENDKAVLGRGVVLALLGWMVWLVQDVAELEMGASEVMG